jgi:isocitrate/isopropylmalate dehydrogenase
MQVDAMVQRMTMHPQTLDTIVATNLHADILSSLAATLSGSRGIASNSNIDPTRQGPSMFEPVMDSRPEMTGKGIANPIGAMWAAAEMMRWLGEVSACETLLRCLENTTEWGIKTRDLGGATNTRDVTQAVCQEIERSVR